MKSNIENSPFAQDCTIDYDKIWQLYTHAIDAKHAFIQEDFNEAITALNHINLADFKDKKTLLELFEPKFFDKYAEKFIDYLFAHDLGNGPLC